MRIVIADCSAVYTGRGDTKLGQGVRAIIIKEDGAVSIHNDAGNKPLNYMGKGNLFSEEVDDDGNVVWKFDTTKENLTLTMYGLISDSAHELILDDEGLVRDGTESHLQEWLAANPDALGGDYSLIQREYPTGDGPVDILVRDERDGSYVAVEVKRTAILSSVSQILRYVAGLKDTPEFYDKNVRGMIAALDIRPKTSVLAEKRGIECVTIDSAWRTHKENRRLSEEHTAVQEADLNLVPESVEE
jgi:RecB family endonuclease NucS